MIITGNTDSLSHERQSHLFTSRGDDRVSPLQSMKKRIAEMESCLGFTGGGICVKPTEACSWNIWFFFLNDLYRSIFRCSQHYFCVMCCRMTWGPTFLDFGDITLLQYMHRIKEEQVIIKIRIPVKFNEWSSQIRSKAAGWKEERHMLWASISTSPKSKKHNIWHFLDRNLWTSFPQT